MKKTWFLRPSICAPCGGKCCETLPGSAFPENFPTPEALQAALATGRWAIDWWEGDAREGHSELSRTLYIRPATKGQEGERFDASWGGECTFLGANGCELKPSQRPLECLGLEPSRGSSCLQRNGRDKRAAAIAWLPRAHEFGDDE